MTETSDELTNYPSERDLSLILKRNDDMGDTFMGFHNGKFLLFAQDNSIWMNSFEMMNKE